ncbi:MAG TPA: C25 family cysteine peptidase, partial [Candidatus Krumholzibacteria bacterium]|nr:C25 family cysteine peptidase [Candidatus Krumholzibacteria bacterium]
MTTLKGALCAIGILFFAPLTVRGAAAPLVDPKKVLEIQPFYQQLGNYFPGNDALSDSGYVFTSYNGTGVLGLDVTTFQSTLEHGNYGILNFGSHGGTFSTSFNNTSTTWLAVEWRVGLADALQRRTELINNHYFQATDIDVGVIHDVTYGDIYQIVLSAHYFDTYPAGCDLAIVSTCDGSSGGSFKATNKLAGNGTCTNDQFLSAHALLMFYMMQSSYKTLNLAFPMVTSSMIAPKVNPWSLTGGDLKFFFECSTTQRLTIGAAGAGCSSGCTGSGCPDVAIKNFSSIDGNVSWYTLFEDGTEVYLIESSESRSGPWKVIGSDGPDIGEHQLSGLPTRKFVRLVEIEKDTVEQYVRSEERAWTSPELTAEKAQIESGKSKQIPDRRPELPSLGPTTGCTSWATTPDYVIFVTGPLYNRVDCTIAYARQQQGYHVRVINLGQIAPGDVATFVRTTIHDYYYEFGTKYFHLVGTWTDDLSSAMWETSDYWRKKREAFIRARGSSTASADPATLPTFLLPAKWDKPTAASTPYVYSDRPYADVDDDGVPDVVVTRWPFSTEAQVYAAYYKVNEYNALPAPSKILFLGYDGEGTIPNYDDGKLVRAMINAQESRLAQVAPGSFQVGEFLNSQWSGTTGWNLETANRINALLPEAIFISGTLSGTDRPGLFFNRSSTPTWSMTMLQPFYYARLVVAASCEAAGFAQAGQFGAPICVDFLGEPLRGAMEWVGPTSATNQAANHLVTMRLIEKLNYNPYRSMAESWLLAMRLAYSEVMAAPDNATALGTLDSYVFLGDPL